MRLLHLPASALLLAASACTPGGLPASGSGGTSPTSVVIDANLTNYGPASTPAGEGGGYSRLVATVTVGTTIVFMNTDGFAHTATSVPGGATTFPSAFPFTSAALQQSGHLLSQGWSSGDMQAGVSSQVLLADKAGTYLFGCFHHYGAPMRGEIVVH